MTEPRIALGITTERGINNLIFLRWLELLRSYSFLGPVFYARGAPGFAAARNIVLKQAWERLDEFTHLLFWDSDQLPPIWFPWPSGGWDRQLPGWPMGSRCPSGREHFLAYLERLARENPDKEVLAGLYFSRDLGLAVEAPHEPVAYAWGDPHPGEPEGFRRLRTEEVVPMLARRGLYRVAGAGTGAMLIRKEVLLRLKEAKHPDPVFEQPQMERGVQRELQWTEDLLFCYEIQRRLTPPVDIWLDTVIESAHQTDVWVSSEHYLGVRRALQQSTERVIGSRTAAPAKLWTPR